MKLRLPAEEAPRSENVLAITKKKYFEEKYKRFLIILVEIFKVIIQII